jgi:hypothetical protein
MATDGEQVLCSWCGAPIRTEDCLLLVATHAPVGRKGCTLAFAWVTTINAIDGQDYLGSSVCAAAAFDQWLKNHTGR